MTSSAHAVLSVRDVKAGYVDENVLHGVENLGTDHVVQLVLERAHPVCGLDEPDVLGRELAPALAEQVDARCFHALQNFGVEDTDLAHP